MTQTLDRSGTMCLADRAKLVHMVAHLVATLTRPPASASVALHMRGPYSCDPSLIPPRR